MIDIVDRRNTKKRSSHNRQRFIKRYKRHLQKRVNSIGNSKKGITDFDTAEEVDISTDDLSEPSFQHGGHSGRRDHVLPGNKELNKGDKIQKPRGEGQGKGRGGDTGEDSEDDFTFTLTKDEFMDIYFSDMALPDFIKDSILNSKTSVRRRAGYTKEGIPARLNLKKTFENAIARKIIAKSRGKKARYLDDTDLRYDYYKQEFLPKKHAVMFCLLDVSGSMYEHEKMLAKKFFLLLYLFLEKSYESVELRFITHTTTAEEVEEEEFFYGNRSGGTIISTALELTSQIIDEDYDLDTVNVYVAQASDGDNWGRDNEHAIKVLKETLLPKVQYYAYVQVCPEDIQEYISDFELSRQGFHGELRKHQSEKCKTAQVSKADEVYPVLRDLFKKEAP